MKTIRLLLLAVALSASAFAGHLVDTANVFGPKAKQVSDVIAGLPVYVETIVQAPPEGLKVYADTKVKQLTERGFYMVITTQPRQWRVSMNPIGLASAEGVRIAGEAFVVKYKRGEFAEATIGLSRELARLAEIKATPPIESTGVKPGTWSNSEIWACVMGGVILLAVGGWFIARSHARKVQRREQLRRHEEQAERNRQERARLSQTYSRSVHGSASPGASPAAPRTTTRTVHHHHDSGSHDSGSFANGMIIGHMMSQPSTPSRSSDDDDGPRRRSSSSNDTPTSYDYGSSSGYSSDSGSSSSDSSGAGGSID